MCLALKSKKKKKKTVLLEAIEENKVLGFASIILAAVGLVVTTSCVKEPVQFYQLVGRHDGQKNVHLQVLKNIKSTILDLISEYLLGQHKGSNFTQTHRQEQYWDPQSTANTRQTYDHTDARDSFCNTTVSYKHTPG